MHRNSRVLLTWPIPINYPKRDLQLVIARWAFVVSYLVIGVLMSDILIEVSRDQRKWTANVALDAVLCLIFIFYCQHVHVKAVSCFSVSYIEW
jgi:hypothetical protein